MAKFKDFGSFGDKPKEPVTFKLYDEEFHCRPALQGKMLLDLIARTTNSEDPAAGARVISEFFSLTAMRGLSFSQMILTKL